MSNTYIFDKEKYRDLNINGFKWVCFEDGIHTFSKKLNETKYEVIECDEDSLTDGTIEFMTEHGMTFSSALQKKIKRKFKKLYKD